MFYIEKFWGGEGREQRFHFPVAASKAVYVAVVVIETEGHNESVQMFFKENYSIWVLLNLGNSVASGGPRGGTLHKNKSERVRGRPWSSMGNVPWVHLHHACKIKNGGVIFII